jgi:hypothetical protein
MTKQINEYRGFSLFNDVDDSTLRMKNRATVMTNIAESGAKEGKISPGAMGLLLGYFGNILGTERKDTMIEFISKMKEKGFELTTD